MVYRIYVEKTAGPRRGGRAPWPATSAHLLGISSLKGLRLLNRYDVEGISPELLPTTVSGPSCSPSPSWTW